MAHALNSDVGKVQSFMFIPSIQILATKPMQPD